MKSKWINTAIIITIITVISKLIGFYRDVLVASYFGASVSSDAYILSQTIVGVFTNIVIVALGTSFIPVMTDYLANKTKQETQLFFNSTYKVSLLIAFAVMVISFVFADEITRLFIWNDDSHYFSLTVKLVKIFSPLCVLVTLVTLNTSVLQSHENYIVPALLGMPANLILIFGMILFADTLGVEGLAYALVLGTFLQVVILWGYLRKFDYGLTFSLKINEEGLKKVGWLIVPILIGSGIQQINIIVDRMLAANLSEGAIAALNFSQRLSLFVTGIFSAVLSSIYYTSMSKYIAKKQLEEYKILFHKTINILIILVIPVMIVFMSMSLQIIEFVFERGKFDRSATEMTSIAFFYYSIGLFGYLMRDALNRTFYAMKDSKAVMINGGIAIAINIILSIILVRVMGVGGLALATSISGLLAAIMLLFSLRRKIFQINVRGLLQTTTKSVFSGLVMGVFISFVYAYLLDLTKSNMLSLFFSIPMGFIVYLVLLNILKVDEIHVLRKKLFGLKKK